MRCPSKGRRTRVDKVKSRQLNDHQSLLTVQPSFSSAEMASSALSCLTRSQSVSYEEMAKTGMKASRRGAVRAAMIPVRAA